MVQTGNAIEGTFMGPTGGHLSGTFDGDVFTFRGEQRPPCEGSFKGSALVKPEAGIMSGSYSGRYCEGDFAASFSASKQ